MTIYLQWMDGVQKRGTVVCKLELWMYYTLYAFLTIIIIIINIIIIIIIITTIIINYYYCCCCYISTQASSNHKACADWPIGYVTRARQII